MPADKIACKDNGKANCIENICIWYDIYSNNLNITRIIKWKNIYREYLYNCFSVKRISLKFQKYEKEVNWFKIEFQKTSNFIGNGNINFYTNLFYRLCQPASHKIEIKLLFWELILLHQKYWHVTSSENENFSTFFWIKVDMKCLFWRKE